MNNVINKRSELLFCYDITDANPNGDPLDENKPRIDEETNINFVTDVRLKRTIRDYLFNYKGFDGKNGKDIFIREITTEEGFVKDVKSRIRDFVKFDNNILKDEETKLLKNYSDKKKLSKQEAIQIIKAIGKIILHENIDTRIFGCTYPVEFNPNEMENKKEFKDSITYTGPVQFKIGRSLHSVKRNPVGHSFSMASKDEKRAGSQATEYILPYAFIAFHGIINQHAAQHTGLTEEDVDLLLEAMWLGTKNLISRSKFGQEPRLLIKIDYNQPNFFIGDLDKKITIQAENPLAIRSLKDFTLNIQPLIDAVQTHQNKIDAIHVGYDAHLCTSPAIPNNWRRLSFTP